MKVNGWGLYCTDVFDEILDELIAKVERLKEKDPTGYSEHETAKHLKRVYNALVTEVPANPSHPDYNLGNTLGRQRRCWKRVKKRLTQRHRLFFQYSAEDQAVVYAWLNDKKTLRNEGAKTDVYRVFKTMLRKGEICEQFDELKNSSSEFSLTEEQLSAV